MILTDAQGRPYVKPMRADFESLVDYVQAVHAYNDRVHNEAHRAFTEAFRLALRNTL